MNIDYEYCRKTKLSARELFIWLELSEKMDSETDGLYGHNIFGRNIMIAGHHENLIRVSCKVKDFDRWANSEEMCFDINYKKEKRAFVDWVEEQNCQ